jgi:mono/diheme cytochrome c family protein
VAQVNFSTFASNMKSRIAFAIPPVVFAVLMAAYVFSTSGVALHAAKPIPVDTTKKNASIKIDEDSYDFHDIELGTKAEHNFLISNDGTDTLVISSTRPSCGCTAAVLDAKDNRIPPGGTSRLKVTFDANNKPEGPISKSVTITSNAKNKPDAMVHIQGRVVKSKMAHKTAMHLDGLFQGDCASCHVNKGKGELGARLFEADCAICHGTKTDGKPGPELASETMLKHTPKQWQNIIENGIPNSAMPAFHTKNKGPLGDEEIASLIEYMGAFKKEAERNNMMKSVGAATNSSSTTSGTGTGVIQGSATLHEGVSKVTTQPTKN